jgi:hypothetical protein
VPTNLFEEPITFFEVMATTAGDHIGPFVLAATRSRPHVVDGVGGVTAIRTTVPITRQHGAASQRWHAHSRGEFHDVMKSDDARYFDSQPGRSTERRFIGDRHSLSAAV